MTRQHVLFLLPVLLGGCSAPSGPAQGPPAVVSPGSMPEARPDPPSGPSVASAAVPFRRFREGSLPYSSFIGLSDSTRVVIRDRDAWSSIWARIHAAFGPELPPPDDVDFDREMVLVAALGARGSGGYSLLIEEIVDRGDHLEVAVVKQRPGRRCVVGAAFSFPTDMVRLRRDARPIRFAERTVVNECL